MSLRFRLNLMIALTLFFIVGVGALFIIHNARRSVEEEVRSSVNLALQWVEAGLALGDNRQPMAAWLAGAARLGKIRHLRVEIRDPSQTWVDWSEASPQPLASKAPTWFAWAVTPVLTLEQKQLLSPQGQAVTVLIEANPANEISEAWGEAHGFLLFMLALAATVGILVHITLGRAFSAVSHILRGMEDIEQGDYGKRLPRFMVAEFDRISESFNHMAEALGKARAENRALTRQSLKLQEEERHHLALELHDELGQSLSAIKVMAASLRPLPTGGQTSTAAQTIMDQCDHLFGVLRAMLRRLRPLMLDELGLVPSLEDMVENWRTRHPAVDIHLDLDEAVEDFVGGAKIHLFRIVQESLTNVAKHAQAQTVAIALSLTEDHRIRLQIADDGRGFDPASPRGGLGLRGIDERVTSLDGRWKLEASKGRGVKLDIDIPCDSEELQALT